MKDLIKHSTIYIILGFLPTAVNFILVPLLTEYLSKEEYGLISISALFQGLVAIFLNIGLDAAFARYYFNVYKKRKLLHAYFSTVLIAVLGISILLFGILWFAGDPLLQLVFKNNRYHFSDYGVITFILSLATILHTVILSYYRNEENLKMYSFFSVLTLGLTVAGILIGVVVYRAGAFGNILGRSIAYSSVVLLYLIWYFRNKPLIVYWKYLQSMLKYGIPFIPYLVILFIGSVLDQWMVERKFSLAQLGEYNFGVQFASLVSVFIYAVFNAISPRLYKLMAEDNVIFDAEIRNLNRIFHFVVVFAIVAELAVISPFIQVFIHNKEYHAMLHYVPLLIVVWLPHLYYMLYVVPIMFYNKTKVLPLIMAISLSVGLAANLLLIPRLGLIGVCVSAIIIKFTSFLVTAFLAKRLKILNVKHFSLLKNHLLAIIIMAAFLGVYGFNKVTSQQYHVWVNMIPFVLFLLFTLIAFRKEVNIVLTLFSKRNKKHE